MLSRRACQGRWRQLLGTIVLLAVVLTPGAARADLTVDTGLGNSPFTVVAPLTNAFEIIGDTGVGVLNQANFANTVTVNLTLGNTATGNGTYNLGPAGTLTVTNTEFIGLAGSGAFTQTGGDHSVTNNLTLGSNVGASGTYNLSSGTLFGLNEIIGDSGRGAFTQSGGTHTAGLLTLGHNAGASGTYDLSGGSLRIEATEIIGDSGSGSFTQSGGTHTVTDELILGNTLTGSGTYNLSGGSASVTFIDLIIGKNGVGAFTQTGGSLFALTQIVGASGSGAFTQTGGSNTAGNLFLGQALGASGTYNLSGGSLRAESTEIIGASGSGSFTQSGGTNTVTDALFLGDTLTGRGTYNLSGGSLTVLFNDNETIGNSGSGAFTQSGGTNSVTGSLILGSTITGSGTYNLSGGSLFALNQIIGDSGRGAFTQSGGSNTAGDLTLGHNVGASGTYNLSGGSLRAESTEIIGASGSGSFTQSGGTNVVTDALILGDTITGSGTYNLSGGSLTVLFNDNETIGNFGSGAFTQSGGTNSVTGNLILGNNLGSTGTYTQSGGSLSAFAEFIGDSGSGAFTQSGGTHTVTDALTLGNALTSSGTYNLSGGSLSVFDNETIGSGGRGAFTQSGGTNTANVDLILGLTIGSSGTYNLSGGSLSASTETIGNFGSGAFTQTGGTHTVAGNLVLVANPGASGTYNLSGGSLAVGGNESIGDGGSGAFTQSGGTHAVTLSLFLGNLAGSGTYSLSGGSLSTLGESIGQLGSGAFTQSGGTNTVAGGLIMGNLLGSPGTYSLSGGLLSAFAEVIGNSGSGAFTQTGGTHVVTGLLTLSAFPGLSTGSYDLQAGSLVAGTVDLNNTGTFRQLPGAFMNATFNLSGGTVTADSFLTNHGTFNYNNFPTNLFAGRLVNYGAVNFNVDATLGNGLANLGGPPLTINAGRTVTLTGLGLDNEATLVVNGTLTGAPLVNNTTGILMGTGTVQGALTNLGTVNPGNSPGVLTVNGSYIQTAGGTLQVEVASASSYDQLKVIGVPGTASLNGSLAPILLNGYRPVNGQIFPGVVTATGGVTGAFSSVTNFSPTLTGKALYSANQVDLLVQRNYSNLALAPLTGNQLAVGNMLNGVAPIAGGDLNTVLTTLDSLPDAGSVRNAYQQISPDKAAALPNLAFAGATLQKRILADRITNQRFAGREIGGVSGLPGAFNFNGSRAGGLMLAYNSSSLAGLLTSEKRAAPAAPESRWGLYLDPALVLGSQQSTVNQTGFKFTIGGFNAGADYRVQDNLLVGLATGYSHTGAQFMGSGGNVQANTWPLTAYVAYLPQTFYAYGSLGYALNLFNLDRQLAFGDLARNAKSSTAGNQFNAYGETGYDLKLKCLVVTPALSLAYSRLWVNGFTESGAGALNLDVASQNASSLQTGVGAKIAAPLKRDSVTVVPQVYVTWQHEYSNSSRGLDARLSQAGSTFAFTTDTPHRNFAVLGANVNILTQKHLKVQLDYNAEVGRGNSTAHYVSAGVRWEF